MDRKFLLKLDEAARGSAGVVTGWPPADVEHKISPDLRQARKLAAPRIKRRALSVLRPFETVRPVG